MAIVPESKSGAVDFYLGHVAVWSAAATTLGIPTADASALTALANSAAAARDAQQAAQLASKARTVDYDAAVLALVRKGSQVLKRIKATAAGSATPDAIYSAAQIPPPALPSPVGAPGTPTDLKVTLNPDGSLTLNWKCANPANSSGTTYNLRRKNAGAAAFAPIGSSGLRSFTDDTVPAGTASAIYEITAVRSTRSGTAAQFVVNFGVSGAGEAFASVAAPPSAKLAA